jgi:ATP-dependent Clp protease ATP-binding subunit ClpA
MFVEDLDIPLWRVTEAAQRVINLAIEDSRRREHSQLTTAHLLLAIAQADWELFAQAMGQAAVNPQHVLRAIDDHLRRTPLSEGGEIRVSPRARLVCKRALHHAARTGHSGVEAADLIVALFEESRSVPASIVREQGAEPDVVAWQLDAHFRNVELRSERLKRRFELPQYLTQVSTNLNHLACLNKLPPVFGRVREIQQVLEILSHRERPNSVMLIGEPGAGKTAIAEGLARRIELEPDTIPVRLRGAQIVNIDMNAVVAGTMLRGMLEERFSCGRDSSDLIAAKGYSVAYGSA